MSDLDVLRSFARLLADAGAHELMGAREGEGQRAHLGTMDLSRVPGPLRTTLRLFTRGETVPTALIPARVVDSLERLGLIECNGAASAGAHRLVSTAGKSGDAGHRWSIT